MSLRGLSQGQLLWQAGSQVGGGWSLPEFRARKKGMALRGDVWELGPGFQEPFGGGEERESAAAGMGLAAGLSAEPREATESEGLSPHSRRWIG